MLRSLAILLRSTLVLVQVTAAQLPSRVVVLTLVLAVMCLWLLPTAGLVGRAAPFRSPLAVLLAAPVVTSLSPPGRRPAVLAARSPCLLARVAAVAAALCRFLLVPRLLALAAPRRLRLDLAVLVAAMCALQVAWVRAALAVRFGWRAARAPLVSAALCRCRLRMLARLARAAA